MKIRMTTDSIRIRIRKSELDQLMSHSYIEDSITFGADDIFRYGLVISDEATTLLGEYKDSSIQIFIPKAIAMNWARTDLVSLEENIAVDEGQQLHLLVEKDFPCLDRTEEDYDDTFWELSEEKDPNC